MKTFMIKRLFLFIVLQAFILLNNSYADKIDWALSFGGAGNEHIDHILVCPNNDFIVIGTFSDTIICGNFASDKDTIICENRYVDVFIARFSSRGKFLWITSLAHGPYQYDWWTFPAVDPAGNLMICGRFYYQITIGKKQANEITLSSPESNSIDIFIARFMSDGQVDWAINAGGEKQEQVWDIASDKSGALYITGRFRGSTFFPGGINDDIILLGNDNSSSIFTVKYDAYGDIQWANSIKGSGDQLCYSIAVNGSGKVSLAGYFWDDLIFGTESIVDTTIISKGVSDIFIALFDSSGNFVWAISEGGDYYDIARELTFDSSENILVTGTFQGTMIMGERDTLRSDDHLFDNLDDIFLAKYDAQGNYLWSLREGGGWTEGGEHLQIYHNDKILLSGFYWFETTFSSGNINETIISNIADTSSHFAAKYNADGMLLWIADVDSLMNTYNTNIAIDFDGEMLRAGEYAGNVALMSEENSIQLSSYGGKDIYLAKFTDQVSSVRRSSIIPNGYHLYQNYPNPFNPTTTIHFTVPTVSLARLTIYDCTGQLVTTLVDDLKRAGEYAVTWDAGNLSSGVYFYRLQAGDFMAVKKSILIK